jgi:hypothetical protein
MNGLTKCDIYISKYVYTHTHTHTHTHTTIVEYYLSVKKNEILSFTGKMDRTGKHHVK